MKIEDFPKRIELDGLPRLTPDRLLILITLYDETSRDTQQPACPLHLTNYARLRSLPFLIAHGYVNEASRDGTLWFITVQGIKLLKAIQKRCRPLRTGNLCAECGQKPRMQTRRGVEAYCYDCHLAQNRRRYHLKQYKPADTPCSRCKGAPRHIRPNGCVATYCTTCLTIVSHEQDIKRQAKRRARIESGELVMCRQCDAPVYMTEAYVYDRCEVHQKAKWARIRHS
jgi:hypothetical protein